VHAGTHRLHHWLQQSHHPEVREGLASHTEKRAPVFDGPTAE
jgi:hypothetical protein